jgi:enoyl-[acyl-carrier protein] reductase II
MSNSIQSLFSIRFPIIQGGMVWHSGWRLATAVSNQGGLGLIGAGSLKPDLLTEHIVKAQKATKRPFGVNIPIFSAYADDQIQTVIDQQVKIVFTSAGSPSKYTSLLKGHGIKVVHVVSSEKFAIKAEQAGVDAIVAEGFEAGGHNGREETTTMCLIPAVRRAVSVPLIAAGGIATGSGILAALSLGADGVQLGSRFAATIEASSHQHFKDMIVAAKEGDTSLRLKQLAPVRLLKNKFYEQVVKLEESGAAAADLKELLGKGRAKKGMFEGDLDTGELEIGQVSSLISSVDSVQIVFERLLKEYHEALAQCNTDKFQF